MSVADRLRPPEFDLAAPLPAGVTVLEASAGTGKTYAITGLAARFVAEGKPLERILLVTFTRMATGELRERVRERLASVQRGLKRHLATGAAAADPVVRLLVGAGAEAQREAIGHLRHALANFDAATIATTHGFCQEALGGLGVAADLEPGVRFVEDLSDLVGEVLDDLYIRRFHREERPALTPAQALQIARLAVNNPVAPIAPANGERPEMRRRLAFAVRAEFDERKRRMAVMTYDDLLVRLREALQRPEAVQRIRDRYDVVLVDEFQDTDPVQWEIMRLAFAAGGGGTLVLVADPKQSIYAFRGADVFAYLQAAAEARALPQLTSNRRSDQQLLDAYDALFGNAKLGHEGIDYRRVSAASTGRVGGKLIIHLAPLRVRILDRDHVECTPRGYVQAAAARARIAEDLAGDIADLLDSSAQVTVREEDAEPGACVPVAPGHIAVLVRTNAQAADVTEALGRAGVPAVINGAGSVFATDGARDWLTLLEALERPASITRAHAAALTPFLGWPARRVAQAPEAEWEQLHQRLHELAGQLRHHGVASLLTAITSQERLPARMLRAARGERHLTDIRHIAQLLEAAARAEQLGLTALAGWLRRRMLEAAREGDEERSRRLESDADAVQVLTIHRSKGLEFPIVYLPFLWDTSSPRKGGPVTFHDPDNDNLRTLDVALEGTDYERHYQQHVTEERGEELRLAYVALTRARHQAVLWWAGTFFARDSPLGRLVFARAADGTVPAAGRLHPSDQTAFETFTTLAAQAQGRVSVEWARLRAPRVWRPAASEAHNLDVAVFARSLDRHWRRTSYTDITAAAHEARVASESEEPSLHDEPDTALAVPQPEAALDLVAGAALATPTRLAELPVGTGAGTLVHQALEAADFAAADLDAELERALESAPARRAVALTDLKSTVAGLRAALETPLGPALGDITLRGIARGDRLDELGFELPLAGGEQPHDAVTLSGVGRLLRSGLVAGDPLYAYAAHLEDPALRQSVRGYLTGSLDLVLRLSDQRFAVIDYKTNWLADRDEPLTAWHYRPQALVAEMHQRHYGLQALLYLVALHRYLRWRLPDYEPERHVAGVAYLFMRGMTGPDTPVIDSQPCGVFAWRPAPGLVSALSDVLDSGGSG